MYTECYYCVGLLSFYDFLDEKQLFSALQELPLWER